MKKLIFIFLLLNSINNYSQNKAKYLVDPQGIYYENTLEKSIDLYRKYKDYSSGFRIAKDTGYIYMFNVPKYSIYLVDYDVIKKQIELITNKKYNDSTTFIIDYSFFNDPCTNVYSNNMSKILISERKAFLNPIKRNIEKRYINSVYFHFFEKDIELKNNLNSKKEYFFSDKNNFFRNNLFLNPTLCGSLCLIKPNGETLVRNGEYRADSMAEHLNPEIWNEIFNSESE